jgi:hypothetical protein
MNTVLDERPQTICIEYLNYAATILSTDLYRAARFLVALFFHPIP